MRRSIKTVATLALTLTAALALTACVAGSPASRHAAESGMLEQAVLGFWHGLIAPVTLIVEVVRAVAPGLLHLPWRLYESRVTSTAYDVGFYLGLTGGPATLWWRSRR